MSSPANRLANYRSYSYYHILAMCDSTATADLLSQSSDVEVWSHATSQSSDYDNRAGTENLGRYNPKVIQNNQGASGRYIVLINGSVDANYVIQRANWTSTTAADAVPGDMGTSIALEGSLQISEPKGISFLDQVVKCCVSLGVNSSTVVFVLKTIFVGHRHDDSGQDTIEIISDIPPLNWICYDATGSFTEAGGAYEMMFVAAGHGAARLPQYGKVPQTISFQAANSLEQTIKRLNDEVNTRYVDYFKCVADQIRAVKNADPTPIVDALRPVRYIFEVGEDYKDKGGQVKYTVTDQPAHYKNAADCTAPAMITIRPDTSLEAALRNIMGMSNEVQNDASVGDGNGSRYEFKIHSFVESGPESDKSDNIAYTVRYRIERILAPKSIQSNSLFSVLQNPAEQAKLEDSTDPTYNLLRNNIMHFDYMYTGKNIDILDFDMKVNMGLAYLQTATMANSFKGQLEYSGNRQTIASTHGVNNVNQFGSSSTQIPVYFGSQLKMPSTINAQSASTSVQALYTMATHSSIEVLESKMRIIGNTELLRSTNATSSPEASMRTFDDPNKSINATNISAPTGQNALAYWSRVPAFCKVKIKMPRNNDDQSLFSGGLDASTDVNRVGFADYAQDFWFDGYYYICGIEHNFESGEFTQTLDMIGLPDSSAFQSSQNGQYTPKEIDIPTGSSSCYSSAGSTASATAIPTKPLDTVPTTPPSAVASTTVTTTKADADTVMNQKLSVSDVTGWNTQASPEVKQAILEAAQQVGVDPVTLAAFAYRESTFRANATAAPASSATGLFQFITDTWNGLVKQGKATGLVTTPGKTPASNDPRFNAKNNAIAGAYFLRDNAKAIGSNNMGDLYLAHFLGPDTAAKVIKADNQNGNTTLVTALGSARTAKIAAANPSIVSSQTTVSNLRTWAANKMSGALVSGNKKDLKSGAANKTVATSQPSAAPQSVQADVRRADNAIAAQQNAEAQAKKKATVPPCGPRATQAQVRAIDNALDANSSRPATTGAMPGQANPVNIA